MAALAIAGCFDFASSAYIVGLDRLALYLAIAAFIESDYSLASTAGQSSSIAKNPRGWPIGHACVCVLSK